MALTFNDVGHPAKILPYEYDAVYQLVAFEPMANDVFITADSRAFSNGPDGINRAN